MIIIFFKTLLVLILVLLAVAYYTYAERKIVGYMQDRIGPNRVGPFGLLQPFADGIKVLLKEIITPDKSNKWLYTIAPILSFSPALAAWAVIPFSQNFVIADINLGLLYLLVMSSVSVYGILIAGWATNSKYAFLGALRSAAQTISYEIAMGFALVGVVIASQSMNLNKIIIAQSKFGILGWYFFPLFPLAVIYFICAIAETNRAPFDMAEGESEIVAGFHVEYSGMPFSIFFLAEYANMLLVSALGTIMFLGGWLSPFGGGSGGAVWFLLKTGFLAYCLIWIRATFPRYRYDQIMHLGWKIFIPLTLVWIVVVAFLVKLGVPPWFRT